jgi:BirA family biotin operon repressor/biotin-[acetyl-CoA-carboxylase] ligase
MELPLSSALVPIIDAGEVGSTNDEVIQRYAGAEDYTTVVSLRQTSGRGRLGRAWSSPAGKTLAVSVLVRPALPGGEPLGLEHYGWLPLIAGVAAATAVDSYVAAGSPAAGAPDASNRRTTLKWPNDVQVGGRKIAGLLAELLPTSDSVVLGAGINLTLAADELPVPTATSLGLEGVQEATGSTASDALVDGILSRYLISLRRLVGDFLRVGADAGASGILDLASDWCSTLGQEVRVQLPGGTDLVGVATAIDSTGRLVVRRTQDGAVQAVAAGDVTHLRYE